MKQQIFNEVVTSSKYLWEINTVVIGPEYLFMCQELKQKMVYHIKYFYWKPCIKK
jgi:hypothetical protein